MGVAIVAVILAGIFKLAYTHWKLRKYTALAKTRAAQKEEGLQQSPPVGRRQKGNDVPFGVRAIESGIEVDGVWISRSNTPANSTPGSPNLSAKKDPAAQSQAAAAARAEFNRNSTVSNMSRLEIPQAAHDSAEALATLEAAHLSFIYERFQSAEYEINGQRASNDSWSGSSGDSHRLYAANPHSAGHPSNGVLQPVPVKPSAARYTSSDLDSLASHRKSHAAETGQLFPRVRVNEGASEWTAVQQPAEHRNFLSEYTPSPVSTRNDPFMDPQMTPSMNPAPESSRGPPSFEEFVRSTSPQGQYYFGEEGIPLQQQAGNAQGGRGLESDTVYQPYNRQAREQHGTGRKASSFSEAV
ncbi:MAG: hypothetical protein Q9185_005615 [Variospora sp. 1 TL-2023]